MSKASDWTGQRPGERQCAAMADHQTRPTAEAGMNAYMHEHTVRTQDPGYLAQHTTPPTSSRPA
jgi:hypothetical protein